MTEGSLILGVIFSAIGFGYFVYGRKQRKAVPLTVGVVLMVMPMVISNTWVESGVGTILTVLPYFVRV